jgi:predicted  nucleic acid-binding Zn-ribbon protein
MINALIDALRIHHGSDDELAHIVLHALTESTQKNTETSLRIALGTGLLTKAQAERLLDALNLAETAENFDALKFSDDPSIAALKTEIDELNEQHGRLRLEQSSVAARREAVSTLEAEALAVRQKASALAGEVEALQERTRRLDALNKELEQ